MPVSPRFGRGVSTDDSPGVVSLPRACSLSLFPRSRSLAGALFVDFGRRRNCGRSDLFLDSSRCFVAQTSVSLRGMRFIALFLD
jgi:hypothetical protein